MLIIAERDAPFSNATSPAPKDKGKKRETVIAKANDADEKQDGDWWEEFITTPKAQNVTNPAPSHENDRQEREISYRPKGKGKQKEMNNITNQDEKSRGNWRAVYSDLPDITFDNLSSRMEHDRIRGDDDTTPTPKPKGKQTGVIETDDDDDDEPAGWRDDYFANTPRRDGNST